MPNYRAQARQAARRYGLDPNVFERQIGAESNFDPNANSGKAVGIAQFTPQTAAGLGINPHNPVQALNGAAKLMAGYVKKFGSYENALRAYNAGPGAVQASHGYAETNNYVAKILHGTNPSAAGVSPGGGGGGGGGSTPQLGLNLKALSGATAVAQAAARPQIQISAPAAPSFAAGVSTPAGYQAPASSGAPTQQAGRFDLQSALQAIQSAAQTGNPLKITGGGAGRVAGKVDVPTGSGEVSHFDGKPVAGWIAPLLRYAQSKGWRGSVTSGYRTKGQQAAIYASGVRPAAKPGTSNHEMTAYPGGAIDVSDAQQLSNILRRSKYAGLLQWAGAKDPVHFSHPHNGGY